MGEKFRTLRNIYFDIRNPSGFSSVRKLYQAAKKKNDKITLADTKKFLQNTKTYSLHKKAPRRFRRRKTIVSGINDQWQIDLINTTPLIKYFRKCAHLVSCIDCFSRKAYIEPVHSKQSDVVLIAFKIILKRAGVKPRILQKDLGSEFFGNFARFLRENNIKYFSTPSSQKCSIVERFNRTIQNKIYKFVTATGKLNYQNLQDIVFSYNNSKHRSIGVAPSEVNSENEAEIWMKQYSSYLYSTKNIPFRVGDKVLISKFKTVFSRGYNTQFNPEIFQVAHILRTKPVTLVLKDKTNNILPGTFYLEQLSKVQGA